MPLHDQSAAASGPETTRPRVLIADDQPDVLEALRLLLKGEGYQLESARTPLAVVDAVERKEFDAVLMDLNYARDTTSGREGLDLLSQIQALDATLPVVVMTAWGSVELAVEAMRRGARDFIQKPWENARLLSVLRTQVDLARAIRRGQQLEAENRALRPEGGPTLIAESPSMQPVLQLIARVGPSEANVLITGENGTGKGTIAQALHGVSGRAARPLVTVNAGGLSEGIFESELFGHVKGAFTDAKTDRVGRFELADSGTLFLDEIANVPMNLQAKLLRVLETGEFERVGSSRTRRVGVRILSATNANLSEELAARTLPAGPAVPPEHDRDPVAPAARPARGHSGPGGAFPSPARPAVPQVLERLRCRRDAGPAPSSLARQHPRARSRGRARRADGPGCHHPRPRARPAQR